MNRIFASLAIIATVLGGAASRAASPYDGKWVGTAPEAGDCGVLTVTIVVKDNVISGNVSGKHGSPYIRSGTVGSDGTAQVNYTISGDRGRDGTVRFSG